MSRSRDPRPKPKEEALEALSTARKMLTTTEPVAGARLAQLRGLLEFTEERVLAIQEVKKVRREPMGSTSGQAVLS
jgi:hypothetical protein